ncbi:MAG: archease [Alkalispirochaetaceae bacterium]
MPYRYVDDARTADVAFEAYAETLEELLAFAWEATVELMVDNPRRLRPIERRQISLVNDDPELLLLDLLGELLYYKDAEGIVLTLRTFELGMREERYIFQGVAAGESIDPRRGSLGVDIKAVALHQFYLRRIEDGWETRVVLDT